MKLTPEELQAIKTVQQRQLAIKEELSAIGLAKINIKTRQSQLEAFYKTTQDMEKQLGTDFQAKYGKGNIDIETGEFTPIEE